MDKEIWVRIQNYEGYYEISSLGRVKSLSRETKHSTGNKNILKEKILKPQKSTPGYLHTRLFINGSYKTFPVHQLVAMAFLGYIKNGSHDIVVDHINDIKTDNRLINLQLLTNRQNSSKSRKNKPGHFNIYITKSNKYNVFFSVDGKRKNIGVFNDINEAIFNRDKNLNIINNHETEQNIHGKL